MTPKERELLITVATQFAKHTERFEPVRATIVLDLLCQVLEQPEDQETEELHDRINDLEGIENLLENRVLDLQHKTDWMTNCFRELQRDFRALEQERDELKARVKELEEENKKLSTQTPQEDTFKFLGHEFRTTKRGGGYNDIKESEHCLNCDCSFPAYEIMIECKGPRKP
jgi:predicted  nucleic acid-binding Zn-ribbon protein